MYLQVPARRTVRNGLEKTSEEITVKLKEQLSTVDSVCITADIWSSKSMRSYLGITCHYLHEWKIKSVMLCCRRFTGSHTGIVLFYNTNTCLPALAAHPFSGFVAVLTDLIDSFR